MLKKPLLYLLFLIPLVNFSQNEWKLKKNQNNIKIYTRSVENINFDEYKASITLETSINAVLTELLDAPNYTDNHETGISYYVKSISDNQHVFYAHKKLPWPIKDRDVITLLTVEKLSNKKIKLSLESLPEALPEKDKTIRVKTLMGHWLLEEKDDKTMITQQLYIDPQGSLPAFVVNNLLIKGPFKTFSELKETIKASNSRIASKG